MDEHYEKIIEEIQLKIVELECKINDLESRLDGEETYKMEQRERD
jgi:hypothetical protein